MPLYPEVVMRLRNDVTGYAARWVYIILISVFQVEEDWGSDPDWIAGIVKTTKSEIMRNSGVGGKGRGGFQKAWQNLLDAGLVVEQPDKTFLVPFFKKKRYDSISPREVRERFMRLEELHKDDLHGIGETQKSSISEPDETPPKGQNLGTQDTKVTSESTKVTSERSTVTSERSPHIIIGSENKKTLSLVYTVINIFYKGIGQEKISKEKRERGKKVFQKLRKDGFSDEDIAFAVEWTLKNAKEEPYDFSIIEHTIGQAKAARERKEAENREIEERERAREEEQAKQERYDKERQEIEDYKESLSPEERMQLREEAEGELRESPEVNDEFINDMLIDIKENEILRRRIAEENETSEEDKPQ